MPSLCLDWKPASDCSSCAGESNWSYPPVAFENCWCEFGLSSLRGWSSWLGLLSWLGSSSLLDSWTEIVVSNSYVSGSIGNG